MTGIESITEYYDAFFPLTNEKKSFFRTLVSKNQTEKPIKCLSLSSATGSLETYLASNLADITATETVRSFLDVALLRNKDSPYSLRFFEMKVADISKFFTPNFFDVIYILSNRLCHIGGETEIEKFFLDARSLLKRGGSLVIETHNYEKLNDNSLLTLSERRTGLLTLETSIMKDPAGFTTLSQTINYGKNKKPRVVTKKFIHPLSIPEIETFAHSASFSEVSFYGGFNFSPLQAESEEVVALIR